MNQEIKQQYQKYIKVSKTPKTGKTHFKVNVYMGKNPLTGESIKHRGTFDTYKEALEDCNKALKDKQDGTYNAEQDKNYKFKDIYKMWLETYREKVEDSTYYNTKALFKNHILKDLGNADLKKLTPMQCQKIVNKWYKDNGYATFQSLYTHSAMVLDYGLKLDLVEKNAMRRVEKPKKRHTGKKNMQFYTVSELSKFLKTAKKVNFRMFVLFRLLSYSGMRIGELLALTWSDVDFKENTVNIAKTMANGKKHRPKIDKPKTDNGYRTVKIDFTTIKYLSEWRIKQRRDLFMLGLNPMDDKQLIFPNRSNKLMRNNLVDHWNKKIAKEAGIKHIKIHGFRHTHASILYDNGATAKQIQMQLGHGSVDTTLNIYTHIDSDKLNQTAQIFSDSMNGI
ncbi:MAG: site-specific integrase [Anaeroplasma bactoclasticum]|nr:site-specific integrase [Anaeroplasma bactoclasticum]